MTINQLIKELEKLSSKARPVFIFDQNREEIFTFSIRDIDTTHSNRIDINCNNVTQAGHPISIETGDLI